MTDPLYSLIGHPSLLLCASVVIGNLALRCPKSPGKTFNRLKNPDDPPDDPLDVPERSPPSIPGETLGEKNLKSDWKNQYPVDLQYSSRPRKRIPSGSPHTEEIKGPPVGTLL